jgi:hypothetical protein
MINGALFSHWVQLEAGLWIGLVFWCGEAGTEQSNLITFQARLHRCIILGMQNICTALQLNLDILPERIPDLFGAEPQKGSSSLCNAANPQDNASTPAEVLRTGGLI